MPLYLEVRLREKYGRDLLISKSAIISINPLLSSNLKVPLIRIIIIILMEVARNGSIICRIQLNNPKTLVKEPNP